MTSWTYRCKRKLLFNAKNLHYLLCKVIILQFYGLIGFNNISKFKVSNARQYLIWVGLNGPLGCIFIYLFIILGRVGGEFDRTKPFWAH